MWACRSPCLRKLVGMVQGSLQQAFAIPTAANVVSLVRIGPVDAAERSPVNVRSLMFMDSDNFKLFAANGTQS